MKNNNLRKKALISTLLFLIICFILEIISAKSGVNKWFGLNDALTLPAIVIKSVIAGSIYYFLIFYFMKRKLRKQTE